MNHNTVVGALFFFGGLAITFITYSAAEGGGSYVLAWGAILFGGVQMVMGLVQGSDDEAATNHITAEEIDRAGIAVILRSMISMAAADGKLEESEVEMIKVVTRLVFGTELADATIREMSGKMIAENSDITGELDSLRQIISWEDADLAVLGMAMVAMSDGDMAARETARLEDYAGALGVDQVRFDTALEKARANNAKLREEPQDAEIPAGVAPAT